MKFCKSPHYNTPIFCAGASHLDNFPEDLKSVVHPHWGTFPPQHPLIVDLFGVIFFFFWIIAFLGNGCVIYIFLSTKSMRSPVGIFFTFLPEQL
jgi:r-opsin